MSDFESGYINPEDISKKDMNLLADSIEDYLSVFTDVMVIPKDVNEDEVEEALYLCRKLVKKLRKGDRRVFKGIDE